MSAEIERFGWLEGDVEIEEGAEQDDEPTVFESVELDDDDDEPEEKPGPFTAMLERQRARRDPDGIED